MLNKIIPLRACWTRVLVISLTIFTLINKTLHTLSLKTLKKYMGKGAIENLLPLQPGRVA